MKNPNGAVIILIEDNPDNLFMTETVLRTRLAVKYFNSRASSRQFFKLLEDHPEMKIDLILLDIQLPYEDGYAILQKIRRQNSLKDTLVVALTANVMPEDVDRARKAGFDGFIGKPINADLFPEQIKQVLAGKSVWEPRAK